MKLSKKTFWPILLIAHLFGGQYAGEFLELGVSAGNLAMGGSCGALDRSNTAFYANPAGLAYISQTNVNLMYMDQFGLAKYNYLGSARPISKTVTLAVNWIHFGVTDIPRRPDLFLSGEYTSEERRSEILIKKGKGYGSFTNSEDALYISLAKMNHYDVFLSWMYHNLRIRIPIGCNIKLIRKHLDTAHGYGIGADFGARINFSFGELMSTNAGMLSFGVTLQDFTKTNIYWDTNHLDTFKRNLKLSAAYERTVPYFQSHLSFTLEKNTRYDENYRFGLEYRLKNIIALRGGYNFNGLNYGCGINFKIMNIPINLDYALLNHDLGNCHRIGLGLWL